MKTLNAEEMRKLDTWAIEDFGLPVKDLMARAGTAVAEVARGELKDGNIVVVSGKGNNGGDAIHAAKLLAKHYSVKLILSAPKEQLGEEAARELKDFKGEVLVFTASNLSPAEEVLNQAGLIIDGLLGFGLQGEPKGNAAELIGLINASGKKVLSVDVPSGFNINEGKPSKVCVQAILTVTFAAPKKGLLHSEKAGDVYLADIGFPAEAYERAGLSKECLFGGQRIVKL